MTPETDDAILHKYNFISQQFTKFAGILQYILCLFGTMMNILTFVQRSYGRRPCSLYLLGASICDLIYLNLGPLTNIIQYGFHYKYTINSMGYCKSKSYFVFFVTIISATLTTLASMDRYLLSSKNTIGWKYSTRPFALRSIQLTVVFWFIVSIPIAFCSTRFHHQSNNEQLICSNPCQDTFCLSIHIIYTCLINGLIPPLLMMFFALLTHCNIRHIDQQSTLKTSLIHQINAQLTSMFVLQSIKSSFASLPFTVFNFYLLITANLEKSSLYQAKEDLANQLFYLLFWGNYTSFFIYLYSSDIFRTNWMKAVKKLACCLYGNRQRQYHYQNRLKKMRTDTPLLV